MLCKGHANSTSSDFPSFKYLQAYLRFIAFADTVPSPKLKICDNPVSKSFIGAIFPTIFCSFCDLTLCTNYKVSLLLYLLQWFVISVVTILSVLGATMNHAHRQQTYLINVGSEPLSLQPTTPPSLCLLGLPYSLRQDSTENQTIKCHTVGSKCSSERKVTSLSL